MAVDSKYVVMSNNEIFDVWLIPEALGELSDRYKTFFNEEFSVQKVPHGEQGVTSGWKFLAGKFENPNSATDSPFDDEHEQRYAFINDVNTVFAVLHFGPGYVGDAYNAAYISDDLVVMDITGNPDTAIGIGYKLIDGNFIAPEEE